MAGAAVCLTALVLFFARPRGFFSLCPWPKSIMATETAGLRRFWVHPHTRAPFHGFFGATAKLGAASQRETGSFGPEAGAAAAAMYQGARGTKDSGPDSAVHSEVFGPCDLLRFVFGRRTFVTLLLFLSFSIVRQLEAPESTGR